ncbi:hypothetical protein CTI12_AA605220 [Artemisia annua]|uniref:Uncharacterized protein n=1 Tax=Artemisia annua TaxID=35608 RepID=A0A2U1KGF7_ARTAN|nr:hypothetical protein CTI12_AA605220 [Artemisia annua]
MEKIDAWRSHLIRGCFDLCCRRIGNEKLFGGSFWCPKKRSKIEDMYSKECKVKSVRMSITGRLRDVQWLMALYVDFFIDVVVIAAWVIYKESSWIVAAAFTVLLCVFGSIATCGYVILQFYKLSPEEFTKDPLYFVLVRHQKRDGIMGHRRGPSVIAARVFFSVLGCFMLGIWIYLLIVYGSPFRAKVFTPCMVGTLINFDANIGVLSVWIAYRESSWISAFIWIFLLVTNGSIITCLYIVWQLSHLSPLQPISLIIFNTRGLLSSDPLLAHDNV